MSFNKQRGVFSPKNHGEGGIHMTDTMEIRMRKIHSRTRQYRARHEARYLACLTACGLLLLSGIGLLLHGDQSPGAAVVGGCAQITPKHLI